MVQGTFGALYRNGWERGVIDDPKAGDPTMVLRAYSLPSLAFQLLQKRMASGLAAGAVQG